MKTLRNRSGSGLVAWALAALLVLGVVAPVLAGGRTEPEGSASGPAADTAPAEPVAPPTGGSYVPYSSAAFDGASAFKRVYFFHASWCPTCRAAEQAFNANLDRIPDDVVLFRIDYDTSAELKRRFAVTYQHTFVLVDENNEPVRKWSGGDIEELIANTAG